MSGTAPLRVAVLLSGGGTTLENLAEAADRGELPVKFVRVISSRADAGGLARAARRGYPASVVASKDYRGEDGRPDWPAFSDALTAVLDDARPDLVVLAGFLCRWHLPARYAGRVLNIHPALLPAFGGRGMYGHFVHEAVAAAGVKVTGCTVHFVTDDYDAGPIVLQRTCPVRASDTPDDLARRVFAEECRALPEAIRLFAAGRLRIDGRVVHVDGE